MRDDARRDLKDGLVLYNTDDNVGLRDAWNTIQAQVGVSHGRPSSRRPGCVRTFVPC